MIFLKSHIFAKPKIFKTIPKISNKMASIRIKEESRVKMKLERGGLI